MLNAKATMYNLKGTKQKKKKKTLHKRNGTMDVNATIIHLI